MRVRNVFLSQCAPGTHKDVQVCPLQYKHANEKNTLEPSTHRECPFTMSQKIPLSIPTCLGLFGEFYCLFFLRVHQNACLSSLLVQEYIYHWLYIINIITAGTYFKLTTCAMGTLFQPLQILGQNQSPATYGCCMLCINKIQKVIFVCI